MSGEALAILSSLSFSFSAMSLRWVVVKVSDATLGTFISIPLSLFFYFMLLIATGQVGSLTGFEWQSYLWLSLAGVLNFVIGFSLYYSGTKLIGANINTSLTRFSIVVALVLGVTILSEPVSWHLVAGSLLIMFGLIIVGLHPDLFRGTMKLPSGIPLKGILFGLGAGIFWGLGAILIRLGLQGSPSPIAGAVISFSVATLGLGFSLLQDKRRHALFNMEAKHALFFCVHGFLASMGNLLRFLALDVSPASVVVPLISTFPVLTIVLSFIFTRKLEIFNVNVIIGAVAVVIGSILVV